MARILLALSLLAALAGSRSAQAQGAESLDKLRAENAQMKQALDQAKSEAAKYKEAYVKVVDSAQQSRTEREQMKAQSEGASTALAACTDKNVKLVKLGREIIAAYSHTGLRDVLVTKEPVTGLKRLELERMAQEYGDRVYEAKFDRRTVKAKVAAAPAAAVTASPAAEASK